MSDESIRADAIGLYDNLCHAIALNKAMMVLTFFDHDIDELQMTLERHLCAMQKDAISMLGALAAP